MQSLRSQLKVPKMMLRWDTKVSSLKGLGRLVIPFMYRSNTTRFCSSTSERRQSPKATGPPKISGSNEAQNTSSSSSSSSDSDSDANTQQRESTYVEEEVNKFRSMANLWWDPNGDAKPLHSLNTLRVPLVRDGLIQSGVVRPECVDGPKPLTGLKVLDVGCGGGILSEPLARLGANVVGLDAAEETIAVARLHADRDPRVCSNVEYTCSTIEQHAESKKDHYNAIVASEVLEHIEATDLFIRMCADVLKPGGSFFVTTINKTTASWIGAILIAEYALNLLPTGTHDWNKFIPCQDLLFMLEKNGFVIRIVHGMAYNPLVNNWIWISPTSINYAIHALKAF